MYKVLCWLLGHRFVFLEIKNPLTYMAVCSKCGYSEKVKIEIDTPLL